MSGCDPEQLEAWIEDRLVPAAAAELSAHVESCEACRRELSWLRGERAWMERRRARAAPLADTSWTAIASRLSPAAPRRRSRPPLFVWVSGGLAAAAAILLLVQPTRTVGPVPPSALAPRHPKLSPEAAVDRAEREYQSALALLESEYRQERAHLPPRTAAECDRTLALGRLAVDRARATVGDDLDGRLALLDGYAEYMHSVEQIVVNIQVKR